MNNYILKRMYGTIFLLVIRSVSFIFTEEIVKKSSDISLIESSTIKPPSDSCEAQNVSKFMECREVGCTLGALCTTKGAENRFCCHHTIHGATANCCPEEQTPNSTSIKISKILIEKPVECSVVEVEFGKYHCYEIGCNIGEFCTSMGMEEKKCCPHLLGETIVNCCLKRKDTLIEKKECQIFDADRKQHCTEMGCEEGSDCNLIGLEDQRCCPLKIHENKITCCLGPPNVSGPLDEEGPLANFSCSKYFLPSTDICPEVGCRLGSKCISKGFLGHPCCPHEINGEIVNCCLMNPPPPDPLTTLPPPPSNETTKEDCVVTKLEKIIHRIKNHLVRIMDFF